jgi:hypothetical protein
VHHVVDVFEVDLPVAADHVADHAAGGLQALAGRAGDHVVEPAQRFAEVLVERGSLRARAHEDEVTVHVLAARRGKAARCRAFGEGRSRVLGPHGNALQAPIGAVGPGVVRAAQQPPRVARFGGHQLRALVGAAVVEDADCALGVAQHHQRQAKQVERDVVAGMRQLARVRDEGPGAREKARALALEDGRRHVGIAVDAVRAQQGSRHRRALSPPRRRSRRSAADSVRSPCG